ncbi:hypothetical protein COOONC_06359 [Cooperia oncophora]
MIPLLTGKTRHRWMHFFVAMAIATLSSDAILHIIPQLCGGHSHDHTIDNHYNTTDTGVNTPQVPFT